MTTFELPGAIAIAVIEPPVCWASDVRVQLAAELSVRHMKRPPYQTRAELFGSILNTEVNGKVSPLMPVRAATKLAPPFVLKPIATLSEVPNRTRKRLPKVSNAAATSPMDAGSAETSLLLQVIPPSWLYFVINDQVSLTKRLSGFFGLIAMHSSALFSELLLMLMFGPTVRVTAGWAWSRAVIKTAVSARKPRGVAKLRGDK